MTRFKHTEYALALLCFLLGTTVQTSIAGSKNASSLRESIVKIYVTIQPENYAMPWQARRPAKGTGTGFILNKKRILTNAHVVSDGKFIEVQKDGDPRRFNAKVLFTGHDCDIAMLTVEDPDFFKNTKPIKLANSMPTLNDEVTVLGFPFGGDRLSITKGIVSRLDYSVYSHSGIDHHLVMQVDAAINPGNSGGPIFFKNKVVALAFQGLMWGDNIGYGIPLPVINHFLKDIEDGVYHGYPELGVAHLDVRNAALRSDLKMDSKTTGTAVYYVDPFGSAKGIILPGDVITSVDGHKIANDGTVKLNGETIIFSELIERKQHGDSIKCEILRKGKMITVKVPLKAPKDPFIYRNLYDQRAEFYIAGGLVFSPLTSSYLRGAGKRASNPNIHQLIYYSEFAKIDGLHKGKDEFVVMTRRLPHQVNTYSESFVNGLVESVNKVNIAKLEDVKKGFSAPIDGYHVIKFAGMDETLVLEADAVKKADPQIFRQYGISEHEHFGEE